MKGESIEKSVRRAIFFGTDPFVGPSIRHEYDEGATGRTNPPAPNVLRCIRLSMPSK